MTPTALPDLLSPDIVAALIALPFHRAPEEVEGLEYNLSRLVPGEFEVELVRLEDYDARPIDLTYRPRRHTTLVVLLEAAAAGGELHLLGAPEPLEMAPGGGWLWHHLRVDGAPDPGALWELRRVTEGALTALVVTWDGARSPRVPTRDRPTLYAIVEGSPRSTREQLARAAAARDVAYVELAGSAGGLELAPGSLLYRGATTHEAIVLEQHLCGEHVASVYAHPLGAHIIYDTPSLWLSRLGVPTPRTLHALPMDPAATRRGVEDLGGFPVVLKVPGRSHGVGVIKLDGWEQLSAVLDLVWATHGSAASLMEYVGPATHWRVIVVGVGVAAAYVNPLKDNDFRTHVDEDRPELFEAEPPEAARAAALDAAAALGVEVAGVDVLEREDGSVCVLEVNSPCYFGHPWEVARIDVAGALVDHLLAKSAVILGDA